MPINVLVAFYSRYGNTAKLAEAIAEGASQVEGGAEVRLRRLADLAPEGVIAADAAWTSARTEMMAKYPEPELSDLEWADAIAFGTPTRYGNPAAEMKLLIDKTGPLWVRGALVNKVGAVFTSTSSPHGGQETTLLTMMIPMAHLGMIIVSPGYTDPIFFQAGSPYGPTSISGPEAKNPPTEADLAAARHTGKRAATIAAALKRGLA